MKFDVENNTNEIVRKILTKMKIEGINSKNLKKKLRREPKKDSGKRAIRQRVAMYSAVGQMKNLRKTIKKPLENTITS